MRLLYYIVCFLFFYIHMASATEYVYPVAFLNNGTSILYIHQFSSTHIELFEWNTITNHSEQILWSLFNPAGLQLLPHDAGFSFIDNGRLRMKLFKKRSPKTIDFDEPLFNINAIQWIDKHTCYCSAQQNDYFSIFQLYDDGTTHCLISKNDKDCMYPQKIGTRLFYIERCKKNNLYSIMQREYPNNGENTESQIVTDFEDKPIIFLNMRSESEGFVIEHAKYLDNDSQTSLFFYHQLIKTGGHWEKQLLFSFGIPTCLFLDNSEQRIFESILPLLPRVVGNKVYFVDCSKNDAHYLQPYCYDVLTMCNEKIITKKLGHCFVPMVCGKNICLGGTKDDEKEPLISFLT